MNRHTFDILLVRVASIAGVIVAAVLIPSNVFLTVAIALGYAHFLLAYRYQEEAGKWSGRKLAVAGFLLAALLLAGLYLVSLNVLIVVVGFVFVAHHVWDEALLLKKRQNLFTLTESLPFYLMYGALLSDTFFATRLFSIAVELSLLVGGVYLIASYHARRMPDTLSAVYFVFAFAVLGAHIALSFWPDPRSSLWIVSVLPVIHYVVWYIEYWQRLGGKASARARYLSRSVVLNVVMLLAACGVILKLIPVNLIFFNFAFFNVFVFFHILTSMRISHIAELFRRPSA